MQAHAVQHALESRAELCKGTFRGNKDEVNQTALASGQSYQPIPFASRLAILPNR